MSSSDCPPPSASDDPPRDVEDSTSPFTDYVDGREVTVQAEVNWNRATNEFVYREKYTSIK